MEDLAQLYADADATELLAEAKIQKVALTRAAAAQQKAIENGERRARQLDKHMDWQEARAHQELLMTAVAKDTAAHLRLQEHRAETLREMEQRALASEIAHSNARIRKALEQDEGRRQAEAKEQLLLEHLHQSSRLSLEDGSQAEGLEGDGQSSGGLDFEEWPMLESSLLCGTLPSIGEGECGDFSELSTMTG